LPGRVAEVVRHLESLGYVSLTQDGVHPNTEGAKRVAKLIIGKLRHLEPMS
jgi:lysophospholipase L1-like esterase